MTSTSGPWALDHFGAFAASIIGLFMERDNHVVRDSIVVNDEITTPNLPRTLLLLFRRQAGLVTATVFGLLLSVTTMPLLCILLKNRFGHRKRIRQAESPPSDIPLHLSTSSEVINRLKTTRSRRERIATTTVLLVAAGGASIAGVYLLLCAVRLHELKLDSSDLAESAIRSIQSTTGDLKEDLRNILRELATVAANQSEVSELAESIQARLKDRIRSNVRPFLDVNNVIDNFSVFIKQMKTGVDKLHNKSDSLKLTEKAFDQFADHVRSVVTQIGGEINQMGEIGENLREILKLKEKDAAAELVKLDERLNGTMKTVGGFENDIKAALKSINDTLSSIDALPSLVNSSIGEITAEMRDYGRKIYESLRQKILRFSDAVDTMLVNKTAMNLRLWEGDMFQTVSAMDARVIFYSLMSIAVVVIVLAVTMASGMAAGAAATQCFDGCNPREYKTSEASSRAASAITAGVYATSLIVWLLLVVLLVTFKVGIYHVDACQSFKDYDILDFKIGALVHFGDDGVIDTNRTIAAVLKTCRRSGNILSAVGRDDLLEIDSDSFNVSQVPDKLKEMVGKTTKIDVRALEQAAPKAEKLSDLVTGDDEFMDSHVKDLFLAFDRVTALRHVEAIDKACKPPKWILCRAEIREPLREKRVDAGRKVYTAYADTIDISGVYETAKRKIVAVTNFMKKSNRLSRKLNDFIDGIAADVVESMQQLSKDKLVDPMQRILNGTGLGHLSCAAILREYDRSQRFTCKRLVRAVAATWLSCLFITVLLPLAMAVGIPAVSLLKADVMVVDVHSPSVSYSEERLSTEDSGYEMEPRLPAAGQSRGSVKKLSTKTV